MILKYIILICVLAAIKCDKTVKIPAVYEELDEPNHPPETNGLRIARHPNAQQKNRPSIFDYKSVIQQDPQKIRYAQQQQVDSYVRAYRQQQLSKRIAKARKLAKLTTQTPQKSETTPTPKEISKNHLANTKITEEQQERKVVDLKTTQELMQKFSSDSSNSQKPDIDHETPGKVVKNPSNVGYEVNENIFDQEVQPSMQRESRVYVGQDESLKNIKLPLTADLLAKPMYVLADPQLANSDLLRRGIDFALTDGQNMGFTFPENSGFQPATKADLEALNALLGKAPGAQLQGLNELLGQQSTGDHNLVQPLPVPQAQIQVAPKDHTPIKEDIVDIANPQVKPNIRTDIIPNSQPTLKPVSYLPQLKDSEENKNIYHGQHEGLQYAAQYAFGYKIRDVHSGNDYGHEEVREGDVAKGHYHVLLPDGRLQQVEYWVDPSGYHAKVTYSSARNH